MTEPFDFNKAPNSPNIPQKRGLSPIFSSTATGSDVTHRIAAPMLGGMLTVMILNLLVLPVIYSLVLQYQESRKQSVT